MLTSISPAAGRSDGLSAPLRGVPGVLGLPGDFGETAPLLLDGTLSEAGRILRDVDFVCVLVLDSVESDALYFLCVEARSVDVVDNGRLGVNGVGRVGGMDICRTEEAWNREKSSRRVRRQVIVSSHMIGTLWHMLTPHIVAQPHSSAPPLSGGPKLLQVSSTTHSLSRRR